MCSVMNEMICHDSMLSAWRTLEAEAPFFGLRLHPSLVFWYLGFWILKGIDSWELQAELPKLFVGSVEDYALHWSTDDTLLPEESVC